MFFRNFIVLYFFVFSFMLFVLIVVGQDTLEKEMFNLIEVFLVK